MKFNWISIIYLLGALQACVLLLGININKPLQNDLKKITSLLMLAMLTVMIYYIVIINQYAPLYPYTDSLGTVAWMAICPLYYLLCRSLTSPKWRLSWKHLLWFPISIVFALEAIVSNLGVETSLYGLLNNPQLFIDLWMGYFFATGIFFVVKSILLIRHQNQLRFGRELWWFAHLLLGLLLVFSLLFVFIRKHYNYAFEYALIGLFEVFIFVFIFRVFKLAPVNSFFQASKYPNQTLGKQQLEQLAQQLETVLVDQKPYLNKKLSLAELAQQSTISANTLSLLFNSHYQSSFYEFINQYRLDHAVQTLSDPEYAQYKITAIAEMSGFNSKATFYKVFREKHQMTPSQYLKQLQEKKA